MLKMLIWLIGKVINWSLQTEVFGLSHFFLWSKEMGSLQGENQIICTILYLYQYGIQYKVSHILSIPNDLAYVLIHTNSSLSLSLSLSHVVAILPLEISFLLTPLLRINAPSESSTLLINAPSKSLSIIKNQFNLVVRKLES